MADKTLVTFTEMRDGGRRAQTRAGVYHIDPDQVGAVAPRSTYTTILVQGAWIHVNHPVQEVLDRLRRSVR